MRHNTGGGLATLNSQPFKASTAPKSKEKYLFRKNYLTHNFAGYFKKVGIFDKKRLTNFADPHTARRFEEAFKRYYKYCV